jgi:hypothetical protein
MIEKFLTAEYEQNPYNRWDATEAHIHADVQRQREFQKQLFHIY